MRPAILFLDTNILLDCPRLEEYRAAGRVLTLVVIPEVMRELHGLSRAPQRGQVGPAMLVLGRLESLARRRGSVLGISLGRSGTTIRVLPGGPGEGAADLPLVLRAKEECSRQKEALVAVVTRDWGVADLARTHRVKSILLHGVATIPDLERGIAQHDTYLDIDL